MDEWTEFDIADPRYDTWALCWPDNQHERYGTLPCPNMTYRDGQWVSPLWCKRDSFRDLVCVVAAAVLTPNANGIATRLRLEVLWREERDAGAQTQRRGSE